ncbi:MAG: toprim domain-containing protein [Archangium sp.]|nr:toprim domain-containing protein [Archangium sp.]
MARVSDVELERLKRTVSVRRLAEAKGVSFKKSGDDNLLGHCPFHDDKTPSFVVSEKKNLWHCLGACKAGGSVIDFVMKAEGVTFRHAVELLREGADLSGPVGPRIATVPKLAAPVDASADDATLMQQVRDYYARTLATAPEALAYLESRGLKHEGLIEHFKLGFSNRTLGLRLPDTNRLAGATVRRRLQALGVIRESGHEHLVGSLVVPIHDEAGAVVGMYGRKVTKGLRPGTPDHLYLSGAHRAAFNSAALAGHCVAIVCEAIIDALSFWVAGHRNVIAAYGVEGFTPHHLAALKQHGVREVLLAYDRDDAGDAAAESLAKSLSAEGFGCYRVLFPRGMDANEFACAVRPAERSLGAALRAATWLGGGAAPSVSDFLSSLAASVTVEGERRVAAPVSAKSANVNAAPFAVDMSRQTSTAAVSVSSASPISENAAHQPARAVRSMMVTDAAVTANGASGAAISTETAPNANTAETETPSAPSAPSEPQRPLAPRTPEVATEVKEEEVVFTFGLRRYRVRGLGKALSAEALKLNVLVAQGDVFHVDTLDMYSARQRAGFLKAAADELRVPEETLKRDLGQLLLKLEALQEETLKAKLAPKKAAPTLSDDETTAALELLRDEHLLTRIVDDFARCGVVGEETNKLVGYLAAVSRKLEEPLAVLIQSSSAAGKSSLMEAVLAFVPEEDKTKYSAMTGQSLFYMGDADLKHKVLAVVEEEGAARASYALKLLQSEGELTIASTGKDPATGKLVTHEYRVEGPTQLFLTTTASELDEELLNRCLVLTVDEERAQTKAIHEKQKEKQTLEGLLARRDKDAVLKLHRNAQRLLRPLAVVNPYARALTFLDDRTRARRDFPKYLTLIRTLALLHQHQRPVKTVQHHGVPVEYVEVTLEDIATANRLAAAVLGRSLDDLPPQTRRLLTLLDEWVKKGCQLQGVSRGEFRFTRRQVREALGWGDTQLKVHLSRLVEFEYARVQRARDGGYEYTLLFESADGGRFLPGLADVAQLHDYDASRSGSNTPRSGAGRPPVGPQSGPGRGADSGELPSGLIPLAAISAAESRNALQAAEEKKQSYAEAV